MRRALRRLARSAAILVALAASSCSRPAPRHVEIVEATPSGEVAPLVQAELARARQDGRRLLVYVGATWCEPCKRFHRAAESGLLDPQFPTLRLLEFDSDRDGQRLAAAGYVSQMIPLFARPATDGRSSGRQMEGSIKGEGAVDEITPRLKQLLAD